jgi:CheY-like chemotaxis protein
MPPCKILIIDDDVDDVEILADAFQQCGVWDVQYVYTAMQAFSYLESVANSKDLPKLIVTDMHLPGMTGQEFLTDLKKMELYRHILVIVLSSTKSPSEIKKALDLGADEYFEKPYSYAEYKKVAAHIAEKLLRSNEAISNPPRCNENQYC